MEHIREKRTLLNNILCRKANWIGHTRRINRLHDVIEGQMMKVKEVGRRKTQQLDDLRNRRFGRYHSCLGKIDTLRSKDALHLNPVVC